MANQKYAREFFFNFTLSTRTCRILQHLATAKFPSSFLGPRLGSARPQRVNPGLTWHKLSFILISANLESELYSMMP